MKWGAMGRSLWSRYRLRSAQKNNLASARSMPRVQSATATTLRAGTAPLRRLCIKSMNRATTEIWHLNLPQKPESGHIIGSSATCHR